MLQIISNKCFAITKSKLQYLKGSSGYNLNNSWKKPLFNEPDKQVSYQSNVNKKRQSQIS